jgi:hypothetical protein
VLVGEAGRSILWRLNAGVALLYRSWPDATIPNRIIVPVLRAGGSRGWAFSATLLAIAYLAVSAASALVLLAMGTGTLLRVGSSTLLRGVISLTMVGMSVWGAAISARLLRRT